MIATAKQIANQRHANRASSVPRRPDTYHGAWNCMLRVCFSLSLAFVFVFTTAGVIVGCGQMLAFSSFTPLQVVHGLTASK